MIPRRTTRAGGCCCRKNHGAVWLMIMGLMVLVLEVDPVVCFRSAPVKLCGRRQRTSFLSSSSALLPQRKQATTTKNGKSTQLSMFMGSDGGLLGVGTPEIVTVLLVGYFVLGPSELFKLTKEIGKFIQNIRTLGTDLTTTLETNMESQLQLAEIRKAQQELNDAFSFRRSINVSPTEEAFTTTSTTPRTGTTGLDFEPAPEAAAAAAAVEGSASAKKRIRRRVLNKAPEEGDQQQQQYPAELEMPMTGPTTTPPPPPRTPAQMAATLNNTKKLTSDPFVGASDDDDDDDSQGYTPEELAQIEADFDKYTLPTSSWETSMQQQPELSRFQQQLSGDWNQQILSKQEELSPLAKVMELIALLEEEKIAKNQRLSEEYRKRQELEDEFYQKQRQVLEQAAQQIQTQAFATSNNNKNSKQA